MCNVKVHHRTVHKVELNVDNEVETTFESTNKKDFCCLICQKKFTRKYNMVKHQKTIHNCQNSDANLANLMSKIDELVESNTVLKSQLRENDTKLRIELKERDIQWKK